MNAHTFCPRKLRRSEPQGDRPRAKANDELPERVCEFVQDFETQEASLPVELQEHDFCSHSHCLSVL